MTIDINQLLTTKDTLRHTLEIVISTFYARAASGANADHWELVAHLAEQAKARLDTDLEALVIDVAGETMPSFYAKIDSAPPAKTVLCVLIAEDDSVLDIDLAALRQVKMATGLKFHRIMNVTRTSFDTYFRRERSLNRPVKLLHISAHASAAGVELADGLVDGAWLSERLEDVDVLLLAGCEADSVGDWLGVVPHVITLAEAINGTDAAILTLHFWLGIGNGLEPAAALDMALKRCAPTIAEYVVKHW